MKILSTFFTEFEIKLAAKAESDTNHFLKLNQINALVRVHVFIECFGNGTYLVLYLSEGRGGRGASDI